MHGTVPKHADICACGFCFLCSHALPFIIALYEAKVPKVLRTHLGACKRQAMLEFMAVNNMEGAQGAIQQDAHRRGRRAASGRGCARLGAGQRRGRSDSTSMWPLSHCSYLTSRKFKGVHHGLFTLVMKSLNATLSLHLPVHFCQPPAHCC